MRNDNFRSVQELLGEFYGGVFVTEPAESDFTISTAAAQLVSTHSGIPVSRIVSNTGTTNFAISCLAGVTITTGILLLPGGTYSLDWYYDGDLVSRPLYAISDAAGGTLHMLERFLAGA